MQHIKPCVLFYAGSKHDGKDHLNGIRPFMVGYQKPPDHCWGQNKSFRLDLHKQHRVPFPDRPEYLGKICMLVF